MTEQEFSRLIGLYRETVFRVAYCYTKSYADSEDISQEVFLKLYTSGETFEADENVRAWLITGTGIFAAYGFVPRNGFPNGVLLHEKLR